MVTFYRSSVCFRFHCHREDLEEKALQPEGTHLRGVRREVKELLSI